MYKLIVYVGDRPWDFGRLLLSLGYERCAVHSLRRSLYVNDCLDRQLALDVNLQVMSTRLALAGCVQNIHCRCM